MAENADREFIQKHVENRVEEMGNDLVNDQRKRFEEVVIFYSLRDILLQI
jgi:hypothetical protein